MAYCRKLIIEIRELIDQSFFSMKDWLVNSLILYTSYVILYKGAPAFEIMNIYMNSRMYKVLISRIVGIAILRNIFRVINGDHLFVTRHFDDSFLLT